MPPMRAHWRHMAIMTKLCFFWPTRDHNPTGKSIGSAIFGRLLVEQFALCYQSVVCLSVCLSVCLFVCLSVCPVLSVTLVYCGQTRVGWTKMKLGKQVGLGPGHIVLDGGPSSPSSKKGQSTPHSPQCSAQMCCGQMAVWIKTSFDREVGLSPSDIVSDGDPAPLPKRGRSPQFLVHVYCGQMAGWIKMPLGR